MTIFLLALVAFVVGGAIWDVWQGSRELEEAEAAMLAALAARNAAQLARDQAFLHWIRLNSDLKEDK